MVGPSDRALPEVAGRGGLGFRYRAPIVAEASTEGASRHVARAHVAALLVAAGIAIVAEAVESLGHAATQAQRASDLLERVI